MYHDIINFLRCPKCKTKLSINDMKEEDGEIVEGILFCEKGHSWNIFDGVVDFQTEEHITDKWSEYYKVMNYIELDEKLQNENPESLQKIYDMSFEKLGSYINETKPKYVIDIATGTGSLLKNIVKRCNNIQIISIDLSFDALRYDRLKVKRLNNNIKVNFLACDGTNLPIVDNTLDLAVSFFGIANMIGVIKDGINEVYRILKPNGILQNVFIVMEENSEGYKQLQRNRDIFPNMEYKLGCMEGWQTLYRESKFIMNDFMLIGESIGEIEQDYVPFYKEWYAEFLAISRK